MLSAVIMSNKQPRTAQQCDHMEAVCLSVISAVRIWDQCDVTTEQRCAVVTSCETTATPHLMRTIVIHTRWRHRYSRNTLTPKLEFRYPFRSLMWRTLGYDKTTLSSTCVCILFIYWIQKNPTAIYNFVLYLLIFYSAVNNLQQWMSFAIWSLQPTLY